MQSRDELGELVGTEIVQPDKRRKQTMSERIAELMAEKEKMGAVSHVVAPLPVAGSTVEIMGLTYKVTFSSARRGVLHLELERPKVGRIRKG